MHSPTTPSSRAPNTMSLRHDAVTISVVFVRAAMSKLPAGSAGRELVLTQAGIPEELLSLPQARVSAAQFAAVWLGVVKVLDDEFFGLDSRNMRRGSFALLCHALISARTLGQAMNRFLRGFALFLADVQGELLSEGDTARIVIHADRAASEEARFAQEIFVTVAHGVLCWLAGQRVPITHADFNYARPDHGDEYLTTFSRSVAFDAPQTAIHVDAAWLSRRTLQDDAALKHFLASSPLSIFVKYRNPNSWSARVRAQLRSTEPAQWPSLDTLARALNTTATTLARRLDEEGTRYQRIKDNLRRDQAIALLSGTQRSIDDIALALGYEDPSAFYRGFRRWTGSVPGAYRLGDPGAAKAAPAPAVKRAPAPR